VARRFSCGQAELIGGMIVAGVLLLILIHLILNLLTSTTMTTARSYVSRSQFEIDRWSERLNLVRSGGNYSLVNTGPVPLDVVRVWLVNGSVITLDPPLTVNPGQYVGPSDLGVSNLNDVDSVVTLRGRVFKVREMYLEITRPEYPPLGLPSEAIIGGTTLLTPRKIYVSYSTDGNRWYPAYAGYYDGTTWYINRDGNWIPCSVSSDVGYTDLDSNEARELVALRERSGGGYEVLIEDRPKTLYVNYSFKELVEITGQTSLVTVFIKVLIGFEESNTQINIAIRLSKSDNPLVNITTYATLSYTKTEEKAGAGNLDVAIYQGYILIPVSQFVSYSRLQQNPGLYDLSIIVYCETQGNKDKLINLEYIAVIAY